MSPLFPEWAQGKKFPALQKGSFCPEQGFGHAHVPIPLPNRPCAQGGTSLRPTWWPRAKEVMAMTSTPSMSLCLGSAGGLPFPGETCQWPSPHPLGTTHS